MNGRKKTNENRKDREMSKKSNPIILLGQQKEILLTQVVLTAVRWNDLQNQIKIPKSRNTPAKFVRWLQYAPAELPCFADHDGVLFDTQIFTMQKSFVFEDRAPAIKYSNVALVVGLDSEWEKKEALLSDKVVIPDDMRRDFEKNYDLERPLSSYYKLKENPLQFDATGNESGNE